MVVNLNKLVKFQYSEKLGVDLIPNHFEKHVNRISQIEIVIYKNLYCLKRINCYQNKKMSLQLSINISDRLKTCKIPLVDPKILQRHQLTPLLY